MLEKTSQSQWPTSFNPDDPTIVAEASAFSDADNAPVPKMHTHPTGQLSLVINGSLELQLENGIVTVPTHCAVWLPPALIHNITIKAGSRTVSYFIGADYLKELPRKAAVFMLNSMTMELIVFYSRRWMYGRSEAEMGRIAAVILDELKVAYQLPHAYTLVPAHPLLQRIALEFQDPAKVDWKMPDWAKFAHMSGRSLSRLVQAETSLTFNDWRLRHIFVRAASSIMQGRTVEETAYDAGYRDASAFIAAFRRFFGTTPGKFRLSLFEEAGQKAAE